MEQAFLDWLRRRAKPHTRLPLGFQDDAALVALPRSNVVVTVDMITDQVDFRLGRDDPRRIGRKAAAVNLSDLAAMAAAPIAAFVAICLPRNGGETLARELYEGLLPLLDEFACPLAGGDTNVWDAPLAISVTLLGDAPHGPLTRSGARPGDWLLATGAFGGSFLGRQFDFTPRIVEALALKSKFDLHAGLDVSDGLSLDLSRMCAASGVGAVLDLSAIPIHSDADRMSAANPQGPTALERALSDGEDFELLLAVPPEVGSQLLESPPIATPLTKLGEFTAELGLRARQPDGAITPLTPKGFLHE